MQCASSHACDGCTRCHFPTGIADCFLLERNVAYLVLLGSLLLGLFRFAAYSGPEKISCKYALQQQQRFEYFSSD